MSYIKKCWPTKEIDTILFLKEEKKTKLDE
jgi:hypothetical protein